MNILLKTGIGGLSLAAVTGTGIFMWSNLEPNGKTLSESGDNSYSGKFGEDFKHHMVSVTDGSNDAWWSWSFEQRWKNNESKDSEFNGVSNGSALKEKCKSAYEKGTDTDMRATGKDTYERDVWRHCSLEGKRPVTVKDSKDKSKVSEPKKVGETYESDLISTKDLSNSRFWEIQEKAFFGENGLGKNASENGDFKKLYSSKEGTLRDKCQAAYEKETTAGENDKKDVLAFCSLNPKKTS